MSSSAYGILAALTSPFVTTLGFIVWDEHWKGSAFALNLFKCNLASIGFLMLSFCTRPHGIIFPSTTARPIYFLILSSACGILLGDLLWLEGLRLLGARRVIVVDSIKPFLAALMGWVILHEKLIPTAFIGMAITIVGVLVVSLDKESSQVDLNDDNVVTDPPASKEIYSRNGLTTTDQQHHGDDEDYEEKSRQVDGDRLDIEENRANSPQLYSSKTPIQSSVDESTQVESITETTDTTPPLGLPPPPPLLLSVDETTTKRELTPQSMRRGYTMATLNVIFDTYGSILTRQYGVGMTTWEINLVRFGFAGGGMLLVAIVFHFRDLVMSSSSSTSATKSTNANNPPVTNDNERIVNENGNDDSLTTTTATVIKSSSSTSSSSSSSSLPWYCLPNKMSRRSWIHVIVGVVLVTFLAPTLSNYALFQIAVAIAITLGSVGPLYVLPLAYLLQHDRPTTRAILGSLLAVTGISILAFWK